LQTRWPRCAENFRFIRIGFRRFNLDRYLFNLRQSRHLLCGPATIDS
jgi:hypothetical protein